MKRIITLAAIFATFSATAQNNEPLRYCGTTEATQEYLRSHPEINPEAYEKSGSAEAEPEAGQVYVIPVVFHILHNYGPENISDAQVIDAVRVLNEDFRKLNADTSSIVQAFKAIAGDAEIEFRLAQKTPQGTCTNGIIRKQSVLTFEADEDVKGGAGSPTWTNPEYMNIWVVANIASGAAGYTYRPAGWLPDVTDGIIIRHDYTGSIGTGSPSRARALTHEVGHWLNLAHTWGNSNTPGLTSNCSGDDGIGDTPNTMGWTSCNLNGSTCNSLDNVQNYMDYSYCTNMFTQGQVNAMRSALNSSTSDRSTLWTTANLNATGATGVPVLCQAKFSHNKNYVCEGGSIQFTDESFNGQTSWTWSFPGGTPSSSTQPNPVVTYNTPGTYNVTLTVGDGSSTKSLTKTNAVSVFNSPGISGPIQEGFESATLDPNKWFTENVDGLNTWTIANVGATGNWSAKLNNIGNPVGSKDQLISVPYDLSNVNSVALSFKVAYAERTVAHEDEFLRVYVSGNCGQTWAVRFGRSGGTLATANAQNASFTPSPSQWTEFIVSNIPSSYITSQFMLKFEFESGGGNNIYIDDINLGPNVGIEDNKAALSFDVFPNPVVAGSVAMIILDQSKEVNLSLYDITGRLASQVFSGNLSEGENRVNIPSDLASGIYILKLSSEGHNDEIKKVIVR